MARLFFLILRLIVVLVCAAIIVITFVVKPKYRAPYILYLMLALLVLVTTGYVLHPKPSYDQEAPPQSFMGARSQYPGSMLAMLLSIAIAGVAMDDSNITSAKWFQIWFMLIPFLIAVQVVFPSAFIDDIPAR